MMNPTCENCGRQITMYRLLDEEPSCDSNGIDCPGPRGHINDRDLAVLSDWAAAQIKSTPAQEWKRAYALIREGADLLLRRRARASIIADTPALGVDACTCTKSISGTLLTHAHCPVHGVSAPSSAGSSGGTYTSLDVVGSTTGKATVESVRLPPPGRRHITQSPSGPKRRR